MTAKRSRARKWCSVRRRGDPSFATAASARRQAIGASAPTRKARTGSRRAVSRTLWSRLPTRDSSGTFVLSASLEGPAPLGQIDRGYPGATFSHEFTISPKTEGRSEIPHQLG
jgi:hypothetical protein